MFETIAHVFKQLVIMHCYIEQEIFFSVAFTNCLMDGKNRTLAMAITFKI